MLVCGTYDRLLLCLVRGFTFDGILFSISGKVSEKAWIFGNHDL